MLGFPLPYRDELLYSTIARYGVHSGIVSPKELLSEVFGDRKVLATSDLPSHLKHVAELYPKEVGITSETLLYRNTLFPLYAPFVGETHRQALIKELTENGKSTVHLKTGAAASRIKQPIYLRYCPRCVSEQLSVHGECYWQRDWQVTGVESCMVHGSLVDSGIRRHDVHRHHFQAADLSTCPLIEQQPEKWQSNLLVQSVGELLYLGVKPTPEFFQWSQWYFSLAVEHAFNRGTQVCHTLVRDKIVGFWGRNWLSRYGLMPDDSESSWLRSIFRKHRKSFSYLEHLVVLHAFMESGWNLSDVVDTVRRIEPNTKIPTKELKGTEVSLLSEHRRKWLGAVKKNGVKQARLNGFGCVYAWLYRRDRLWLMEINRSHKLLRPSNHKTKVDWHKRDVKTLKILSLLRNESESRLDDPRHSANWYLNQLEHKAMIEKHLDLLPLCHAFLGRYSEDVFEYQIRRLTRTAIGCSQANKPLKRWQVLRMSGLSEERLTKPAQRFLMEVLKI